MQHTYDAALSPEKRKAEVLKYYDSLRPLKESFVRLKEQNECPQRDINEFKILSKFGAGSFGAVYRAESNSVSYAIKQLVKNQYRMHNMTRNPVDEKIFTYAMGKCPFIVDLLGSFKDELYLYLIMEFAEFGNLSFLQDIYDGEIPEDIVRRIVAQIVLGLQYIHACGVMNRDLKPENTLMFPGGRVKIADLGQAFHFCREPRMGYTTPFYRSPESFRSNSYNEAVDWWALGVVTYTLLCNDHPFCEISAFNRPETVYDIIMKEEIHFDRPIITDASEHCKDLISRLLKKDPSERIGMEREGSLAVQNHEWFKPLDLYEVLFNPQQLDIDYRLLKAEIPETMMVDAYPFKAHKPDSEDPQRDDFKDF